MMIADALQSLFAEAPLRIAHPHRDVLRVTGKDSARWLQALVTADVLSMPTGAQCYALLLEKKGRIVADLYMQRTLEGYDLSIAQEVFENVEQVFERHIIMEDVELTRVELGVLIETFEAVAVSGGKYPRGRAAACFTWETSDSSALDATSPEGRGVRAVLGVPAFGVEFDTRDYPQEAGFGVPEVSMSKGCYLGQEVVCMIQMRGSVSRALHVVTFEQQAPVGDLKNGHVQAGSIRGVGQIAEHSLGFAMLKRASAEPGTRLADAEGRACTVVA